MSEAGAPGQGPGRGASKGGPDAVERVLAAVGLVPTGRVVSYGDIGAIVGVGPRQIGAIMRDHGSVVPWWRVVSHDGVLVPLEKARARWAAEGIVVRPDGRGCRMRDFRADVAELATEFRLLALARGWGMVDSSTT